MLCDEEEGELTAFEAVWIPLQTNIGRLKSLGNIAYSQDSRRSANEIPSWIKLLQQILTYWKARIYGDVKILFTYLRVDFDTKKL